MSWIISTIMKNNPIIGIQCLEQRAIDALSECYGYDCVEYDNGTFECDKCPIYQKALSLCRQSEKLLMK